MQRTRYQLFSGSSFTQNEYCRVRRCNLLHLFEQLAHGFRRTDNFLKHRRAIDFLSQFEILVVKALFSLLAVIDVRYCSVPANDLAAFVFQRVVLNELPAIPSVLEQKAHFRIEWKSLR